MTDPTDPTDAKGPTMFSFTFDDAVTAIADDDDQPDAHEIAHHIADNSGYVIYPHLAWELVTAADQGEIDRADDAVAETAMVTENTSMYDHVCYVAYWIIYYRVYELVDLAIAEAEIAAEEDAG